MRPLDVVQVGLIFVALVWLFAVFPFDFSHLADVLPSSLRFLLRWISDGIARAIMAIGIIALPVIAAYTAALYVYVRRGLRS